MYDKELHVQPHVLRRDTSAATCTTGRFGVTCLFRLGRCGHASLVGGVVRMRETV